MIDDIVLAIQHSPDLEELKDFFEKAFVELPSEDLHRLGQENIQTLDEWFSIDELCKYIHGQLIEARNKENVLIGAAFAGKQNPVTRADGKKAELFILAVAIEYRGKGIGRKIS